jgi:nicotinate-nucleotide--dimethylbenzimidazole phosphoribosyltransferase
MVLEKLDLSAFLHADMCLGEGTGAVACFPLLDMACAVYNGMSTFQDVNIEEYKPLV